MTARIITTTRISNALSSKEGEKLLSAGLRLASTDRQLNNGTIALVGKINGKKVKYAVTSSGCVLSNRFVARVVDGTYPLEQYRKGLRAVGELLDKRTA